MMTASMTAYMTACHIFSCFSQHQLSILRGVSCHEGCEVAHHAEALLDVLHVNHHAVLQLKCSN